MNGSMTIHLSAGAAAAACLLCPLVGRVLIKSRDSRGLRRPLHPALMILVLLVVAGAIMIFGWAGILPPSDALFVAILSLALGFGLTAERFQARRAVKLGVQSVLATLMAIANGRLPVTGGVYPLIEILVTILFIVALLNALAVLNFLDGLSSLVVFVVAAIVAVVLNLGLHTESLGDPAGVIFALSLCGLSLWFFIYSRPSSKFYMGDYGTLMLNLGLALLLVRVSMVHDQVIAGAVIGNPAVLVPIVLVIPILLASLHREQKALFRRSRLALILILAGHTPYAIPILHASGDEVLLAALLVVASIIVWTGTITQGRTLRGWSLRCLAEPLADILRIAALVTTASFIPALWLGLSPVWVLAAGAATTLALVLQVAFWRRHVDADELPEVVVFGRQEHYQQAEIIFRNCADLFGRRRARRSRTGLRSKHLRDEVLAELKSGHTVLILSKSARRELAALRGYDDLIFAGDCLLLRHLDPAHGPRRLSPTGEWFHDLAHRAMALTALVFLAPALLLIAAAIRLDDGGPIFFRQRRLGYNGRRFTLLKFRSMRVDAARYSEAPRTAVDLRITRVGRILRQTSLDELPQLINVLRGEMRLVGPRPEMPFICSRYTPRQRCRLDVPPGLTGLWQISPHRNDPIHEHVEYDLAYGSARSPTLDLAIMIATVLASVKSGY